MDSWAQVKRSAISFLVLVGVVGLTLVLAVPTQASEDSFGDAEVNRIINQVLTVEDIRQSDPTINPARKGQRLGPHHAVRTEPNSRAEIVFDDGSVARVGEDSMMTFSKEDRKVNIGKGAGLIQVPKGSEETQVRTATATASLTGTTVMVGQQPNQSMKAIVIEGSMNLSQPNRAGESRSLEAGDMVVMSADSSRIPEPVKVDLQELSSSSSLVNGFEEDEQEESDETNNASEKTDDGAPSDESDNGSDETGDVDSSDGGENGSTDGGNLDSVEDSENTSSNDGTASSQSTDPSEPTETSGQTSGLNEEQMSTGIDEQQEQLESGELEQTNMVLEDDGTEVTLDETDDGQTDGTSTETNDDATEQTTQLEEEDSTTELEEEDSTTEPQLQEIAVENGQFVEVFDDGSTNTLDESTTIDEVRQNYDVPIESPEEIIVSNGDFKRLYQDGSQLPVDSSLTISEVYSKYRPEIPVQPEIALTTDDDFFTGNSTDLPQVNGFTGELISGATFTGTAFENGLTDNEFLQWNAGQVFGTNTGKIEGIGVGMDDFPSFSGTYASGGLVSTGGFFIREDPLVVDGSKDSIMMGSLLDDYQWQLPAIDVTSGMEMALFTAGTNSTLDLGKITSNSKVIGTSRGSISLRSGAVVDGTKLSLSAINGSISTDNNTIQSDNDLTISGKTSSSTISISNSSQLRTLSAAKIRINTNGGEISINNSLVGYYDGSSFANIDGDVIIDTLNSSEDGTISVKNTDILAQIVKLRARGSSGLLEIGGANLDAGKTVGRPLKLFAPGSSGTLRFTSNTELNSANEIYMEAKTVRIDNGVEVKLSDPSNTLIYADTKKYRSNATSPGNACGGNQCGKFVDNFGNAPATIGTEDAKSASFASF